MQKMGDTEDDGRYSGKPYFLNRQKHHLYSRPVTKPLDYYHDDEEEEEDDEYEDYFEHKDDRDGIQVDESSDRFRSFEENEGFERYPKRQRLRSSVSGYEFASSGDVQMTYDSTEHEAFVLLEVWGDRFLQLGRRSLRSEDWVEVAEKVSEELRIEKTEAQCRRMMDNLKRKYKKEKVRAEKLGMSKWVFYKKMDILMGSSSRQECGLACGLDSGEFVFMNTKVYLDRSNGFDEMMDSPAGSELEDDDAEGAYNGGTGRKGRPGKEGISCNLLAESVQRFGKIYEKIESSKKEQMNELEKIRMDFNRELELQKRQILERAQAEIAKIQEEDDDEENDSAENLSE